MSFSKGNKGVASLLDIACFFSFFKEHWSVFLYHKL